MRIIEKAKSSTAPATFSTKCGTRAKRPLPTPPPVPILRSNISEAVSARAEALETEFPKFIRSVDPPRSWEDLYRYFDAYDLYLEGVDFCFHVITQIGKRNVYLSALYEKEISDYAREWVSYHRDEVVRNPEVGNLTRLFSTAELEGLETLTNFHMHSLVNKLDFFRRHLMAQFINPQATPRPLYRVPEGSPMHPGLPVARPQDLQRTDGGRIDQFARE